VEGEHKKMGFFCKLSSFFTFELYSVVDFGTSLCVSFFVKVWWLVSKNVHNHRFCIFSFQYLFHCVLDLTNNNLFVSKT
jgi:hypothetical protein